MNRLKQIAVLLITAVTAGAQTLNVQVGQVTYQFPASQVGDMPFSQSGSAMTIMGKTFSMEDVGSMTVTDDVVADNSVSVIYSNGAAEVKVAGNVAQYVAPTISGAHVSIAQTNTDAVDGDEITYNLSGTATDGEFALSGNYKCTVSLDGVTLTNPSGAAINITNKKRIQISAKKDTESTLTDCSGGTQKGCIYSKGQIQLQGNGILNVYGNTAHAIKSGDYISVKNLTLNVLSAVKDGISCNGYFQMKSGVVNITGTGDDGIQCDLDGTESTGETADHDEEDSGNIYLEDGTLNITATAMASKCIKSGGSVFVTGGSIALNAQGTIDLTETDTDGKIDPSYASGIKADGNYCQSGGEVVVNIPSTALAARGIAVDSVFTTTADSDGTLIIVNKAAISNGGTSYFCTAQGIKAGDVAINGGTIAITMSGAASKGIKADKDDGDGCIDIAGGTVTVTTSGAGASDATEQDGKGCAGLNADGNITISDGTITLTSSGTGGKGLKTDSILTISGGIVKATATGSNYSSGSYSASAKAIKAGYKVEVQAEGRAMAPGPVFAPVFGPGGGGPGGGGGGPDGGGGGPGGGGGGPGGGGGEHDTGTYDYYGGIVISGGTVIAIAKSHEAIESKSTIEISGGQVYAESSDDAMNSASDFTITGGYVMGNSSGNDGLDSNGDFYIKGGSVFAIATTAPEVGIDANTEGQKQLYITGGNVVAIGGLESGSSVSISKKTASYTKGKWYAFKNGTATAFSFLVPSNSNMPSGMTICAPSTPSVSTLSSAPSGTSMWNGYGVY